MKSGFKVNRALYSPLLVSLVAAAAASTASCGPGGGGPTNTGGAGGGTTTGTTIPTTSVNVSASSGAPSDGVHPSDAVYNLGGFKSSAACKDCHEGIYNDWKYSMHSRALLGPVMAVEANELYGLELKDKGAPDPQRICVQCHSPISSAFAGTQVVLPFKQEGDVPADALTEGVGCVTCHAYTGLPEVGAGGLSDFLNDFDASGLTYFGPLNNPATSPAHQSAKSGTLGTAPESLCLNCHNVFFDSNQDGKIVFGEDLVLQNTSFEHDVLYLAQRDENCVDCHMPKKGTGAVADGPAAPAGVPKNREIRHHGFIGADFPIDDADNDVQFGDRQQLLADAATLLVSNAQLANGTNVSFNVTVTNNKAGHNLPTGFAFARQMWVEVRITGQMNQAELATSGVLRSQTDDLCDGNSLNDQLQNLIQGCIVQNKNQVDPQLVNFQAKLVTDVDRLDVNGVPIAVQAATGRETAIQIVEGGAVARSRPIDNIPNNLAPLAPFESRTFGYKFTIPQQADGIRLEVKLKFRSLPPYMVRSMAQREPKLAPRLTQNLGKLKTITMQQQVMDL